MEILYDYESFEHIKECLSPTFLKPITFSIQYLPKESGPNHYMSDDEYLYTRLMNNKDEPGEGPDFKYRINKNGFRGDHFEKFEDENINILVAGCSYTFGEGVPEEYIWAKLLQNKIQKQTNKKVKMYNLGYMGNSTINIISLIKSFIYQYGKPHYLFICFPDLTRDVIYDKYETRYKNTLTLKRYIEDQKKYRSEFKYVKNFIYENNIYRIINSIHTLEMLCDFANIELIWTAWHKPDIKVYQESKFKYFLEIDNSVDPIIDEHSFNAIEVIKLADEENIDNFPYWKKARDMNHPGSRWHNIVSDLFLGKVGEKNGKFI